MISSVWIIGSSRIAAGSEKLSPGAEELSIPTLRIVAPLNNGLHGGLFSNPDSDASDFVKVKVCVHVSGLRVDELSDLQEDKLVRYALDLAPGEAGSTKELKQALDLLQDDGGDDTNDEADPASAQHLAYLGDMSGATHDGLRHEYMLSKARFRDFAQRNSRRTRFLRRAPWAMGCG